MTKRKAITYLTELRNELRNENSYIVNWKTKATSLIKDCFGENSPEYKRIASYKFSNNVFDESIDNQKVTSAIEFIDNCIASVNKKGVIREEKSNFLSTQSNGVVAGIITAMVVAIGSACYLFGAYTTDVKNYDLRKENEAIKDTLSTLRARGTYTNEISQPDTTKHNESQ